MSFRSAVATVDDGEVLQQYQRQSPPADPEQPPMMRDRSAAAAATTTANGGGGQCTCCPYGFHIDLDFVKYAETVSKGDDANDHIRQQARKARKKKRKSMELLMGSASKLQQVNGSDANNGRHYSSDRSPADDSAPHVDRSAMFSPMESIFSDSLEDVMSDFAEAFSTQSLARKQRAARHEQHRPYTNGNSTIASPMPIPSGYASSLLDSASSLLDSARSAAAVIGHRRQPPVPPPRTSYAPSGYTSDFSEGKRQRQYDRGGGYTSDIDYERSMNYDRFHSMPRNVGSRQQSHSAQPPLGIRNYPSVPAMEPRHAANYHRSTAERQSPAAANYRGMSGHIAAQIDSLAKSIRSPVMAPLSPYASPSASRRQPPRQPQTSPLMPRPDSVPPHVSSVVGGPLYGATRPGSVPNVPPGRKTPTRDSHFAANIVADPYHRRMPHRHQSGSGGSEIREMRRKQQEAEELERIKWEAVNHHISELAKKQKTTLKRDGRAERLIEELYNSDNYSHRPAAAAATNSAASQQIQQSDGYEASVAKLLQSLEETKKRPRSKSEGRLPSSELSPRAEYPNFVGDFEKSPLSDRPPTIASPLSPPAPPRPPPPAPPRRRRQEEARATELPPLIRTKSGNIMNMDGFHSVARRGSSTLGRRSASAAQSPSYRTHDDDYVSDSEVALGDRSLSNIESLRRSKKMLERSSNYQKQSNVTSQRYQRTSSDFTQSDVEDYETKADSDRYSIPTTAYRQPQQLRQATSPGESTTNKDTFKNQISQWRQEFLAATSAQPPKPAPLPVVQRKTTYDRSAMTDPPPIRSSVGVEANIEPLKKSEASLEIKMVACEKCENKPRRSSVGVGTGPLVATKPAAPCNDCADLRVEIDRLRVKPIRMSKGCVTDDPSQNRTDSSAMTETPSSISIGITAEVIQPKPVVTSTATNTTQLGVIKKYEIGVMTEKLSVNTVSLNTEATPDVVDSAVNTQRITRSSIGVSSDDAITGCSFLPPQLLDGSSSTDLDLDSLLKELEVSKQRPVCRAAAVNTDSQQVKNAVTSTAELIKLFERGVGTEPPKTADAFSSTDVPVKNDSHVQTDPEVKPQPVVTKSTATCTVKLQNRSQYSNTEKVDSVVKATDTGIRQCDATTNTSLLASSIEGLQQSSMHSLPDYLHQQQQSTRQTSTPRAIGTSQECQTEPFELPTYGRRSEEEEDVCDELWLMPEQPTLVSIGVGDSRVDSPPLPVVAVEPPTPPPPTCETCSRRQETFTRHVGVGVCSVTDRVCVNCDCLPKSVQDDFGRTTDESITPGFSFESSPAYADIRLRRERSGSDSTESSSHSAHRQQQPQTSSPPADPKHQGDTESRSSVDSIEPDYDDDDEVTEKEPDTVGLKEDEGLPTPIPPLRKKKRLNLSKPRPTRAFELSRAAAVKKLLTSDKQPGVRQDKDGSFRRGTAASKSMRVESKKGDSLAYITDKKATNNSKEAPPPSSPKKTPSGGLKTKVNLKKEPPPSKVPDPIPANIPRPKIVKYASKQPTKADVETPEEAAEADDYIAPLRSEMVLLRSWPGSPRLVRPATGAKQQQSQSSTNRKLGSGYDNPAMSPEDRDDSASTAKSGDRLVGRVVDNPSFELGADSGESSDETESIEEGSYVTNEVGDGSRTTTAPNESSLSQQSSTGGGSQEILATEEFVAGVPFKEACQTLSNYLTGDDSAETEEDKLIWAQKYLQHEWLKSAARRQANPNHVETILDILEGYSKRLLHKVVNMYDQNENTALHYAVSHGNFDIVSLLLDSKVSNLNRPNKAGYTAVMLAALCPIENETECTVVQRLFQMGDVNVKASQHGQTALMLAVSHGKTDTARMLVDCGAGLNIQDEDGSTALMCAAEHGHKDIVRLLLAQPETDASLADFDGSTALSIAVENGHRDIGVLIYAHLNYGRGSSVTRTSKSPSTSLTSSAVAASTDDSCASEALDGTSSSANTTPSETAPSIENSSQSVDC